MLNREAFEAAAARVTGLGTARHAQLLFGLVRWLRPEVVVEVGAFTGGTTVWLARALQENGQGGLVALDDFSLAPEAEAAFWANLGRCGVDPVVALGKGRSSESDLWPDQVDFAYIDGDHSFEGCARDVEQAITLGAQCIVVHDIASWWGPRRWLTEKAHHPDWGLISAGFDEGLAVMLRKPRLGPVAFSEKDFPTGAVG